VNSAAKPCVGATCAGDTAGRHIRIQGPEKKLRLIRVIGKLAPRSRGEEMRSDNGTRIGGVVGGGNNSKLRRKNCQNGTRRKPVPLNSAWSVVM